ncbi:MAG TPA: hypothetical protein VMV31_09900 [Terriglobales bacterium]|nr:hypothetical protein [Terriglobales bacterium]
MTILATATWTATPQGLAPTWYKPTPPRLRATVQNSDGTSPTSPAPTRPVAAGQWQVAGKSRPIAAPRPRSRNSAPSLDPAQLNAARNFLAANGIAIHAAPATPPIAAAAPVPIAATPGRWQVAGGPPAWPIQLPSGKVSVAEFARLVRAKYPEYNDIANHQLATAVLRKYPEYRYFVIADVAEQPPSANRDGEGYVSGQKIVPIEPGDAIYHQQRDGTMPTLVAWKFKSGVVGWSYTRAVARALLLGSAYLLAASATLLNLYFRGLVYVIYGGQGPA